MFYRSKCKMNIASEAYIYLRATEQQAPAMILVLQCPCTR